MKKPAKPTKERRVVRTDAWFEWLDSKEGRECTKGRAGGFYLENRLLHAFMAGYDTNNFLTPKKKSK